MSANVAEVGGCEEVITRELYEAVSRICSELRIVNRAGWTIAIHPHDYARAAAIVRDKLFLFNHEFNTLMGFALLQDVNVDHGTLRFSLHRGTVREVRIVTAYAALCRICGREVANREEWPPLSFAFRCVAHSSGFPRNREAELEAEVRHLSLWLQKIDGGDHPCTDESQLRQWAFEALTLRHEVE